MSSRLSASTGFSLGRLDRIGSVMKNYVDRGDVAGIVVRIGLNGRPAYQRAFGLLEVESGRPMSEDAIFRIYSMSKPIAAVAAMILYEEGRLLLDEPISRYLPAFERMQVVTGGSIDRPQLADAKGPITARHLLMHTSGIVYPSAEGSLIERLYARGNARCYDEPLSEMARKLAQLPLAHQPGQAWHYGLSLDLMGHLVEVISGMTFDRFLQERLFEPLNMLDTGFYVPAQKADRYAACYGFDAEGRLEPRETPFDVPGAPPTCLSGGGGLLSTAEDYGRFCQMLLNGGELGGVRVLGRKTVELMTRNHMPRHWIPFVPPTWPFRQGHGMAFGVRTVVDVAATGLPGSPGAFTWQGAAGTDFWVDPSEGLYGVIMTQVLPGRYGPAQDLRVLTYQALTS